MLSGLWTAESQLVWSPQARLWFLALVQSTWWGLVEGFPQTLALLQPWREYQQMMLRTWTTGELPVPGSVPGHSSGSSYANKTSQLCSSGLLRPPHFFLFIIFLLSVRNLRIIKPAENIMQTGKLHLISGPKPLPQHTLYRYLCNIYWGKKGIVCDANDWHANNGSSPLQSTRRKPRHPRRFCMMK